MFLQLMGTNSNGFNLFGPTQDHHFSTIVKRMNDYREATGQFFPVAIETGKSEEVMHDYYLDLLHSDGKDAPLQRFEQIIPVDEDSLLETSETFCERIISSVSYYFGLRSLAAQSVIRMQEPGAYQEVLSLLLSMGLMSTLPMLERVSCLKGGPLLILVEVDDIGGMLTLTFGSNDPKAVKTLSKQLLSNPLTKLK
jgi:hypothetical protein